MWRSHDFIFMQAYKMIQLVSDISQVRCVCYFQITLYFVNLWEIHCYFKIILYCQTKIAHIESCSCNCDYECIMIICVDNYFNNIVYWISQFCEFNQFMSYVVLIIWIWVSCHTCSSNHEHIIQHIQHAYQIIISLWQDMWFM